MGPTKKSLIGCLLIACMACSTVPRRPAEQPPVAVEISDGLYRACDPPRTGHGVAHCSIDEMLIVDHGILALGQALERATAEAIALRATGALDIEAERSRTEAAETELASPWRNPWVTIPIALAVGFGIGFGLGFSQ